MKNAVIHARIDARLKEKAQSIFAARGLSFSEGINRLVMREVMLADAPASKKKPNAKLQKAITATKAGTSLQHYGSFDELLDDLDA